MLHFAHDPDNRPPSILITTLATQAYRGELDLFTATRNALASVETTSRTGMARGRSPTPRTRRRTSPTSGTSTPNGAEAFIAWHRDITSVLDDLAQLHGKGLHVVASRMAESFDPDAVRLSAQQYGDQRRPTHHHHGRPTRPRPQLHGQHTDARN
jgi:hypothetical protein